MPSRPNAHIPVGAARQGHSALVSRLRTAGCVFAEDEAELLAAAAKDPADLEAMVARRVSGLPLEHVLGWAKFCGLRIAVEPGVFVPRHRTEFLVQQAAALARPGAVVVDLCCGSGAVGAALEATLGHLELHAVDIDPAAVRCARQNIAGHAYVGDLYEPLPAMLRHRVDLLVANVPYVPSEEIELLPGEARLYEPRVALDGGGDGLDVLRRVGAEASDWLTFGGHMLVETSEHQSGIAVDVLRSHQLTARVTTSDEFATSVVIGTAPSVHTRQVS